MPKLQPGLALDLRSSIDPCTDMNLDYEIVFHEPNERFEIDKTLARFLSRLVLDILR